ncbi:MAG: ROK family protein [Acetatifactor sp.]|nr:ROK family protein [Acetatifactor sp.]
MEGEEKKIIALDIGGTFVKYGVFTDSFREIKSGKEPTVICVDGFFRQICGIVERLSEEHGDYCGIAISAPGFIDTNTGINTDFSIDECFTRHNLKRELGDIFDCPVAIENDCNCAALAERDLGSGRDGEDFLMITLGTGIGGAIVRDNKLYTGANFKAGELGFCILGPGKEVGATSLLVDKVSRYIGEKINGEYVFAHMYNEGIAYIYEKWLEDLAVVIGNAIALLDPKKVLIGGGISAEPAFINDLREKIYSLFPFREYTQIAPCHFKNDAGKWGAVSLFIEQNRIVEVNV